MEDLPPFVRAEREALIAEIEAAFDGVTREGGVSWSQSTVADAHGAWPLKPEYDTSWQDLVNDADWKCSPGLGGFGFLNPIGFRYYLPVQMTRCVREGQDDGNLSLALFLTVGKGAVGSKQSEQWSLFDARQRRCVKRFLQYMDIVDPTRGRCGSDQWEAALASCWRDVPDTGEPTASPS